MFAWIKEDIIGVIFLIALASAFCSFLLPTIKSKCLAPYIRPLIFVFSNKVSGTGGFMFRAW